tara:strand:+ start:101 stop:661 length:561 start_codon:yes stop_codon:yes gene_type:complete
MRKTVNKKYSELTKKTKPIFPLLLLNDVDCDFKLAIITKSEGVESGAVIKDDMGRWVTTTINHDDFSFIKLASYQVTGTVYDHKSKKKITVEDMLEKYLPKRNFCQLFSLNNKIIIQNDDDISIFSLKTVPECQRLMNCLSTHFNKNNIMNCLLVKDTSTIQRKQLYKLLIEKGFKKPFLYKHYTQ